MKDFLRKNSKYKNRTLLILGLILLVLGILDLAVHAQVKKDRIYSFESQGNISEYPILKTGFLPQISARGAIVMDADSGVVLYEKNPHVRFSTASTAKIMTALTALEHFELSQVLTVKEEASEGSVLGLKEGQRLTFENLLYGLLLPSANDAALVLAQNYQDSEEEFIEKMNENAQKFNLYNTHFGDSSGLLDDQDFTTPIDLARLSAIALKNETFAKIVATREKTIGDVDGTYLDTVTNLNKLLGVDGVEGVKTGFTQGAGEVLVTAKKEKGKTIIIVVMGSKDRFADTQSLLSLVSGNITYLPIRP